MLSLSTCAHVCARVCVCVFADDYFLRRRAGWGGVYELVSSPSHLHAANTPQNRLKLLSQIGLQTGDSIVLFLSGFTLDTSGAGE